VAALMRSGFLPLWCAPRMMRAMAKSATPDQRRIKR
jgi:hypothetical protein